MNLFFTSPSVVRCAMHLDDKRLNKMIVETAQLLSTAVRMHLPKSIPDSRNLYKATHQNHSCAKWVASSPNNYYLTWTLLSAYLQEYRHRFHKTHKTTELWSALHEMRCLMWPDTTLKEISGADEAPHCFHPLVDRSLPLYTGYQETLRLKWSNDIREPKWTNREVPCFAN